jgi:hypothetical protein
MASHIERRKFLAVLGGAAALPLAAHAQQPAMNSSSVWDDTTRANLAQAFRRGLSE